MPNSANDNKTNSISITGAGVMDENSGYILFWFEVSDDVFDRRRIEFFIENNDYKIQESGQKALAALCRALGMVEVSDASEFVGKEISQLALDEIRRITKSHGRQVKQTLPSNTSPQPIKDRYVYVISCMGTETPICKIGIAGSPEKRLKELSTSSPHVLRIEYARFCKNARCVEVAAHEHFSACRKNGEWFSLPASKAISFVNDNIDKAVA